MGGAYHGEEGFKNFSHRMSVYDFKPVGLLGLLWQRIGPNISLPYSDQDVAQIKDFLKPLPPIGAIVKGFKLGCILLVAFLMRRKISTGFVSGIASTVVVMKLLEDGRGKKD